MIDYVDLKMVNGSVSRGIICEPKKGIKYRMPIEHTIHILLVGIMHGNRLDQLQDKYYNVQRIQTNGLDCVEVVFNIDFKTNVDVAIVYKVASERFTASNRAKLDSVEIGAQVNEPTDYLKLRREINKWMIKTAGMLILVAGIICGMVIFTKWLLILMSSW